MQDSLEHLLDGILYEEVMYSDFFETHETKALNTSYTM